MRGRVHAIRTLKGLVADLRFIIHILYYYIYLILLLSYKLENKNLTLTNIFQFVLIYIDRTTIHVFYIDFC